MAKWGTGAGRALGPALLATAFLLFWTTGSQIGQPPTAQAQGYYEPYSSTFRYGYHEPRSRSYRGRRYRSYRGRRYRPYRGRRYRPYRRRRPPQQRSAPRRRQQQQSTPPGKADWAPEESVKDPLQLVISLSEQRLTVYQGDREVVTSRVSSGRKGYATPTGVFSILQKRRHHRSNIYSRAPMPFMQRLTWSGIALHGSNSVPDRPASHGCVRLPPAFAKQLFKFTERGAHVVVAESPSAPVEIRHDALFQPAPPPRKDYDTLEAERVLAAHGIETDEESEAEDDSDAPLRILITRRNGNERLKDIQRLLNQLGHDAGDVDGLMGPDTASAIRRFQEAHGLDKDELVSDTLIRELYRRAGRGEPREGHIYVRQEMKPVFDAPVKIRDPDKSLGAHLLTAMHFEPGDRQTRWLKISLGEEAAEPRREARAETGASTTDAAEMLDPLASSAEDALDRIEIPQEMRERIEAMLTPGSSVAISDGGISQETTPEGTDFVVLTE